MSDDKQKIEINSSEKTEGNSSSNTRSNKTDVNLDKLDLLLDIPLEISVELGRTKLVINELLKLSQGSIIELPKIAGETLDIFANHRLIAKGEVVSVNDKYGIRLTEIISAKERLEKLG